MHNTLRIIGAKINLYNEAISILITYTHSYAMICIIINFVVCNYIVLQYVLTYCVLCNSMFVLHAYVSPAPQNMLELSRLSSVLC